MPRIGRPLESRPLISKPDLGVRERLRGGGKRRQNLPSVATKEIPNQVFLDLSCIYATRHNPTATFRVVILLSSAILEPVLTTAQKGP